jgi:hypothetical protein
MSDGSVNPATTAAAPTYLERVVGMFGEVPKFFNKATENVSSVAQVCFDKGTYGVLKGEDGKAILGKGGEEQPAPSKFCAFAKSVKDDYYTPLTTEAGKTYKDLSARAGKAYHGFVETASTCVNEGTYGVTTDDAGVPIPTANKFCAFAKSANDGYVTPGLTGASKMWTKFTALFTGEIFGHTVTAKEVGTVVAALAGTVIAAKAVQMILAPAKKKAEKPVYSGLKFN